MTDRDAVVVAYWRHYAITREWVLRLTSQSEETDEPTGIEKIEWADWEVRRLVQEGGTRAVELVSALAASAPDEKALAYLGAGPLEDLINWHGIALMDELDRALDHEPKLRQALGTVRVHGQQLGECTRLKDWFDPQRDEYGRLPSTGRE